MDSVRSDFIMRVYRICVSVSNHYTHTMQSNIRKIFMYIFTWRRNFRPLVPIFYMTLEWSSLAHFWFLSAISMGMWLLCEIPTGYLSDRIGHKKTLVMWKIAMVISTLFLLIWASFWHFSLYYVFFSLALSLRSWTLQAFSQEVFEELGKWDQYGMVMWKIKGNASLLSIVLIIVYPILFAFDPYWAFWTAMVVDILWLILSLLLVSPKNSFKKVAKDVRWIISLFWEFFQAKNFLIVAGITGLARVTLFAVWPFKETFLIDIGYPVALIWLVMGLSRFFRFVFGRAVGALKEMVALKTLIIVDFTVLSLWWAAVALVPMPWYMLWFLMSVIVWFYYGRAPLYTHYLLEYIPDKNYKATFLSIKGQLESIVWMLLPIWVAAMMAVGYQEGFLLVAGIFGLIGAVGFGMVRRFVR